MLFYPVSLIKSMALLFHITVRHYFFFFFLKTIDLQQAFGRFHVCAEKPSAVVLFFNVFCSKRICFNRR